jgi:hypothetical protein
MIPPPEPVKALLFSENGVAVVVMVVPDRDARVNCWVPATCRRIVEALLM